MNTVRADIASRSNMDYIDVKNLAKTGEGTYLEFKRTIPSALKIAREMAAMANTHGGTLLVGVDDDGALVGVDAYQEELFLLQKASNQKCDPTLNLEIEIVQFGKRDLLVVHVLKAERKPVYVVSENNSSVFIRDHDQSKHISPERVRILEHKNSEQPVTFTYGLNEQKLFRYLNEYGEINIEKCTHLLNKSREEVANLLVTLVKADILRLFTKDKIDYFTFSKQCESK